MAELSPFDFHIPKKEQEPKFEPKDEYKAELIEMAQERQYSSHFIEALSQLNKKELQLQKKQQEMNNRVVEISDFVEKSYPHMKSHIVNYRKKDEYYFNRAKDFIGNYYPSEYIDDPELSQILSRYGIINFPKYLGSNISGYVVIAIITICAAIPLLYWYEPLIAKGEGELLVAILAFIIIGIILGFATIYFLDWLFRKLESIYFHIKSK